MNWYKHYLGDYARKTAALSLVEHGVYRVLLDHYYATLSPLPMEHAALCRITRAVSDSETEAVKSVVSAFFVAVDGKLRNKRADEEIAKWQSQASINRELGKLGGRPRKTDSVSQSVTESGTESRTESRTEPKPSPEVRSQKLEVQNPKTRNHKNTLSGEPDGFAAFWAIYPRREAKQAAIKSFRSLAPPPDLQAAILANVKVRLDSDQWQRGFIPLPASYLNGRRWEDEDTVVVKHNGNGTAEWKKSESGIQAKRVELGVKSISGESWQQLIGRIEERMMAHG